MASDSGATGVFVRNSDQKVLTDIVPDTRVRVEIPNGQIMKSSHRGYLRLPRAPDVKVIAYVLPDLARLSLLSLGALCDAGMTATLDHGTIKIYHKNCLVLEGVRNSSTGGLWMIDLPTTQHVAMNIYPTGTIAKLVAFYHGCFCSPSISTFKKVLALGTRLPGINERDINKYPPISAGTAAGHLDETRWMRLKKALQEQQPELRVSEGEDINPLPASPPRGQYVFVRELPLEPGLIHGDSTGPNPIASKSGNMYVLIMFAESANFIYMGAYGSRDQSTLTKAFEDGFDFFRQYELYPTYIRLDNEKSKLFESMCKTRVVGLQYVPPGQHRGNKAERAIRTGRNHIISATITAHPNFPKNEWDRLINIARITLNLMRPSVKNPLISAYESLCGPFIWDTLHSDHRGPTS